MSVENLLAEVSQATEAVHVENQRQVRQLLREVQIKVESLRAAKARFAKDLAPDFRLFDFLRTDENGLSRCLAALLDPGNDPGKAWGHHGQGALYAELFLQALADLGINEISWATASTLQRVELEKVLDGERRLDIYLQFDEGAIGIENKPWAADQKDQLADYAKWMQRSRRNQNFLLVFLSNREPSEYSIDGAALSDLRRDHCYVRLDYKEDVIPWLTAGVEKTHALTVRLFIEQLILFIRSAVNQELDMSELEEVVVTILDSANNIEAAFQVQESLGDVKSTLIGNLHDQLKARADQKQVILRFWLDKMRRGEKDAGFEFYFSQDQWQSKMISLCFEFKWGNLNELMWGMRAVTEEGVSQQTQEAIYEIMEQVLGPARHKEWWAWCAYGNENELDCYRHWYQDPKPWIDIKQGRLAKRIMDIVCQVRDAFSDPEHQQLLLPTTPGTQPPAAEG